MKYIPLPILPSFNLQEFSIHSLGSPRRQAPSQFGVYFWCFPASCFTGFTWNLGFLLNLCLVMCVWIRTRNRLPVYFSQCCCLPPASVTGDSRQRWETPPREGTLRLWIRWGKINRQVQWIPPRKQLNMNHNVIGRWFSKHLSGCLVSIQGVDQIVPVNTHWVRLGEAAGEMRNTKKRPYSAFPQRIYSSVLFWWWK